MAIVKYTLADKNKVLNHMFTVGDFYLDSTFDYIMLDEGLVARMTEICDHYGKKCKFPTKNSAFRTRASNIACGGAPASKHLQGIAADFSIDGVSREELAKYAESIMKDKGGIGIYSGNNKHIHLDTRTSKMRWWIKTSNSNTPGFGGYPCTFAMGNRSPAIIEIQAKLNDLGFNCGKPDGLFGIGTEKALMAFQTKNKLTADGVFGKSSNNVMKLFNW